MKFGPPSWEEWKELFAPVTRLSQYIPSRKTAIIASSAAALLMGGYLAAPHVKKAYKSNRAQAVLRDTADGISQLEASIHKTQQTLDTNAFLLLPDEKNQAQADIAKAQVAYRQVNAELQSARSLLDQKQFDSVREHLHPTFNLDQGQRQTPLATAQHQKEGIDSVCKLIITRRQNRDQTAAQELDLMSWLASPLPQNAAEKNPKHALLSATQFDRIPKHSPDMEQRLRSLDAPELYNALGVLLLDHQHILIHVDQVCGDRVRRHAHSLYDQARADLMQVRPLNDALDTRYRPALHDGTFTQERYNRLLSAQERPLLLIAQGKQRLDDLVQYNTDLHTQYYSFVSGQDHENTSFRHTRTIKDGGEKWVDVQTTDEKGRPVTVREKRKVDVEEHYSTPGRRFFYTVTHISPKGTRSERLYAGERDSYDHTFTWRSFPYPDHQTVGRLIIYKPLHKDNDDIVHDSWVNQHHPTIQQCR